jgi:phosphoserine phosphatase
MSSTIGNPRLPGRLPGLLICLCFLTGCGGGEDPLPSWERRDARRTVVDFVERVTDPNGPDFVAPEERVAVFDNDGTLIVEQPTPIQFEFMYARVRALAPERPDWATTQPFAAVLENDEEWLRKINFEHRRQMGVAVQANMTADEYADLASDFLSAWRHPRFDKLNAEIVYQPMRELVRFLQANQFRVFIVSGGGMAFIRSYAEDAFGVAKENVIGSSHKAGLRKEGDRWVIDRREGINSINAARYKPLNIWLHTGRRPILAVGNSDGDLEMLAFTEGGAHASLALLVVHDDAAREYAYQDGALEALDLAASRGWTIVSMREDFRRVFDWQP